MFLTNLAVNKDIKSKENFADNHFQNILILSDVAPNFPFPARERMRNYYF